VSDEGRTTNSAAKRFSNLPDGSIGTSMEKMSHTKANGGVEEDDGEEPGDRRKELEYLPMLRQSAARPLVVPVR
jgi:hypothetical protein